MVANGRNRNGQFTPGHRFSRGRPSRRYSITSTLAAISDEPETIDNDGNTITKAQAAAKWLWDCALDRELPYRDRLDALKTILSRTEPDYKLTAEDIDNATDQESELVIRKLEELTQEELHILKKLALDKLR